MTLGNNWGYVPGDRLKSTARVIHSLIEIVAKGGNLLLGIGPRPDGTLDTAVVQRLQEIGAWMNKNGAAIYNTRATTNYKEDSIFFTKSKSGSMTYALVCLPEKKSIPSIISWKQHVPKKGTTMNILQTGEKVKWVYDGKSVNVYIPSSVTKEKGGMPALAFSFVADGT
jgi:alpha-L-fucosidase